MVINLINSGSPMCIHNYILIYAYIYICIYKWHYMVINHGGVSVRDWDAHQ